MSIRPPIRMAPLPIPSQPISREELNARKQTGQINALIDYQTTCAKAAVKFLDDLEKIDKYFKDIKVKTKK